MNQQKTRSTSLFVARDALLRAWWLGIVSLLAGCGLQDPGPQRLDEVKAPPSRTTASHAGLQSVVSPSQAAHPIDRRLVPAPSGYAFNMVADNQARAINGRHSLVAQLGPSANLRISPASAAPSSNWSATLSLSAVGRPGAMQPVPEVTDGPTVTMGSVRYRRGALVEEWFANGPLGYEQGFELSAPPAPATISSARAAQPLVLDIAVAGDLRPVFTDRPATLALQTEGGTAVLRFGALVAWDANGDVLPSSLGFEDSSIQLTIEDANARYPITIDPMVWVHDQKLTQDSTGTSNDQLGWSVAVSGDTAVVGAHGNDENGVDAGAVYVFERTPSGWTPQHKLMPSDGEAGDYFGYAVALDGDLMLVGAYGDDDGGESAGAVYSFARSGDVWVEQQKLVPTSAKSEDYFGIAVSMRGQRAIVGASGDDEKGSMAGAAYVFQYEAGQWQQDAKLTATAGSTQDQFGVAVSIDDTTVVVGANGDDEKGSMAGAAYVFVLSGSDWSQEAKLIASDGGSLDRFGSALSVRGDSAVVGAYLANPAGPDSGAAYVFSRSAGTWTEDQKLVPNDGATQSYFGTTVAIDADTVLVGANGDDGINTDSGAAYVFRRNAGTWVQHAKVLASDGTTNDTFGVAVALDADTAVVGATGDDDTASASGAVYMLGRDQGGPDAWGEEGKGVAFDGVGREYLGYATATDGDTIVAAGHGAADEGLQTGAAYVFVREASGWQAPVRLTAAQGAAEDRFGFAVGVSGDTVVVGAYQNDDVDADAGCAYVFERSGNNWVQRAKLLASDAAAGDRFGVAVAVDGDTILVGAHGRDDAGGSSGAVYVFTRSGTDWIETQKLGASDAAGGDTFGRSVAIDGDDLIVGSPNDDDGATNAGAAYVFARAGGNWTEQAKLSASDPGETANFGLAVDIAGDTAVAGAYRDAAQGLESGSAYVFTRTGSSWDEQSKLVASDAEAEDRFGRSVAVSGGRVLVGSYFDDDKGQNSGSVYVFEQEGGTWVEEQKLTADDAAANDYFGFAVAAAGATAVCGAYGDDDKGNAAGAVYAFELRKTVSELCGSAVECESGYCVDGVCCGLPACPDCQSCAVWGTEGQCAPAPAYVDKACGAPDESDCTQPDTCDTNGVCQPNHLAVGASCGSSESSGCTEPDTCDGYGTCLPNDAEAGAACGDDAETACTHPDTCNGAGVCGPNHEPDGTACTDGQCEDGACTGDGGAGGTAGAAGSSGTGGNGGSSGSGGAGNAAGSSSDAADSDGDSGCGCRAAGSKSRGGSFLLAVVGLLMFTRWRRPRTRSSKRRIFALALASGIAVVGCGDSGSGGGSSGTPDGGAGAAGADSGSGGDAGAQGGTGGTGGSEGGAVCPEARQCGLTCCVEGETCTDGQCVPECSQQLCGDPPVCCAGNEQCYQGTCVGGCEAPRVLCGDEEVVCCDEGNVCFNRQCVLPGDTCLDFADCDDEEYCEPTLGVCLPAGALPACEYRPPVGEFSPLLEWAYSPSTAPYVRSSATATPEDVCAAGGMPLAFPDADESTVVVPLGALSIPFFDRPRQAMLVSTNGWLTFDAAHAAGPAPQNLPLASDDAPDALVAPYWDDLTHVTACVQLDEPNARVVVQWRGEVAGTGEWVRFQAIMHADTHAEPGVVEFVYLETGATQDGDGATVGIAEPSTGRVIEHGFDRNGAVAVGTTLRYQYVPLHNRFDALSPPAVFDVDGDGHPEVLFAAYDETTTLSGMPNDAISGMHSGVLTILNGEDGTIQHRPTETPGYQGYLGAGAALSVGDLDGDGTVEIVGVGRLDPMDETNNPYVKAFRADGTLLWVSSADVGFNHNGWGGGVHIADFDGDGLAEVFFARSMYDHEGTLLWSKPVEYGSPATTAADLDADGDLELVSDRSAWHHDGTMLWERTDLNAYHFPSVADFDLDGTPEVALVGSGSVIILSGLDGTTFWGPTSLETPGGGPLNIGDFDGDGYPEIGTAGEGLYLVLDLQCTGDPLPDGCDREGVRWGSPTKDISSNVTGSSLFDFEGDGVAEVVYSDECFTRVYSGTDGRVLFETSVNTRTATEYPLVADVDGDNNAEILVVANEHVLGCNTAPWNMGMLGTPWEQADYRAPFCTSALCGHRGLAIYGDALDNWVRTRRVWSGHAYHITNVLSSGAIPQTEAPNWLNSGQNNFRMNAQGSGLFSAPDLEVDLQVDEVNCPAKLRLRADVFNSGALGVSIGVNVAFHKRVGAQWECLGVVKTAEDLLPGDHTEVTLDYILDDEMNQNLEFRAVVDATCDGDGQNNECEDGGEANNESTASGLCESPEGPA